MRRPVLTFLTDYGNDDGFVGLLHAVVARIAPEVRIIDLDHTIEPFNVRLGALRLERAIPFIENGVHVAVVDPGVGGTRRPIALETELHTFVGPDNGLLPWAARRGQESLRAFLLDKEEFWLTSRGHTFDGRDLFAPVGAHLATGRAISEVGTEINPEELVVLDYPRATRDRGQILITEVLDLDRFGNVELSAESTTLAQCGLQTGCDIEVEVNGKAGLP